MTFIVCVHFISNSQLTLILYIHCSWVEIQHVHLVP